MENLFRAYKVETTGTEILAYLIESTAPDNIDDKLKAQDPPDKTVEDDADKAIENISTQLHKSSNPTLVISIHGFNNPRNVVLPGYLNSFICANKDKYINNNDVVCIGYRWPSEEMGASRHTIFQAAPLLLIGLFWLGVVLGIFFWESVVFWSSEEEIIHVLAIFILIISVVLVWIPLTLFLLRIVVYFRDGYRATSFGIPDLVEIIRQIHKKLEEKGEVENRVQLSFIGHSMGAYVVTSAVRILSDVFDPATMREGLNSTRVPASYSNETEVLSKIGRAFRLKRLVLVSPDIPAEALISSRANFLSACLYRCEESFLFSNEGDEVLRQISTTANYFSFPTKSNKSGYRLGNVCLPEVRYGISKKVDRTHLQVGPNRLDKIYEEINKIGGEQLRKDLPEHFSYFDCTHCVENGRGMLTRAKPGYVNKMMPSDHFFLLLCYIIKPRKYDVHGGYFRSQFLSELIYRLACIGRDATVQAYNDEYNGEAELDKLCRQHQIRAMLKS